MKSQELEEFINNMVCRAKIILYSDVNDNLDNYDIKIKKPFLPQKITDTLNTLMGNKKKKIDKNIDNSFIEKLLDMPSSKIKNILAGTEITIKIKFPKESK